MPSEEKKSAAAAVACVATQPENSAPAPEVAPADMDSCLNSLEKGSKPWFLSSATVYHIIEQAVIAAPISTTLLNRAVDYISSLTAFINDKTKSKIPVVDHEKAQEILQRIDGLLTDVSIRVDDGVDWSRAKLAVSLRHLLASITAHSQMIKLTCVEKLDVVSKATGDGYSAVKTQASGKYEQARVLLTALLESMRARYPAAFDKVQTIASTYSPAACSSLVQSSIDGAKVKVVETSNATTVMVLKTAHPYVHNAYTNVVHAVEVSQPFIAPYVVQAKPFVDPYYEPYVLPLMNKAESTYGAWQQNETVGPYLKSAVEAAFSALEFAKVYCMADDASAAVDVAATEAAATTELAEVPVAPAASAVVDASSPEIPTLQSITA